MANTGKTYLDLAGLTYYDGKIKGWVNGKINDLDVSEFALASVASNVVTIKGIKEVDGKIAVGTDTTKDIVLEEVAYTGAAADVSIADAGGLITATDVEGALQELAQASSGGVASKTVWLKDDETVTTGYLKTYGLYQGANSPDAATSPATLIGKIDIPKDLVVTAGKVVTVTNGVDSDGEATTVADGTYVKLTIANQTEKVYINVADLCDVYTAAQSASQVQLAISATNEISATLVDGGVATAKLADSAVTTAKIDTGAITTAKIADDAVTADKVSIAAHAETQTAGADGLALSVTTTDGQVSAVSGSIAANTYDAYGAATAAVGALDVASIGIATYTAGTAGAADTLVLPTILTETDGIVAAGSDTVTLSTITNSEIDSLFA